jgi:hypothetical protein
MKSSAFGCSACNPSAVVTNDMLGSLLQLLLHMPKPTATLVRQACAKAVAPARGVHLHLLQLPQRRPHALAPLPQHLKRLQLQRLSAADAHNLQPTKHSKSSAKKQARMFEASFTDA